LSTGFINGFAMLLFMIISFMSCITNQNPTNNQQKMKELVVKDAEIYEIVADGRTDETLYQLTFTYERKLRHGVFYYQQHSGIIKKSEINEKCTVTLTKKQHELPRSIYPLLTQGYIVVQFSWLGMETYQVIKAYKKSNSTVQK
jgi:hypothetical protein